MKLFSINYTLLVCLCWTLNMVSSSLYAQNSPIDSPQLDTPRYLSLQANEQETERVRKEIAKYRLEMLLRQWWNLPTDKEASRLAKGRYARYDQQLMPIGGDSIFYQKGHIHRRTNTANRVVPEQNIVVMGWHPYWLPDYTYKSYNFALLSHVGYYSYELNPFTGSYRNFDAIHAFRHSDFVGAAHLDTCDVLLTVSARAEDAAIFFTGEPIAQQNLIDSLIVILKDADADGIELNFEEVPRRFKDEFTSFVKNLSFEMREANNSYTIMMSVPLYDKDDVYDLDALKPAIDYFIINAFQFPITPLGLVRGPLAPLQMDDAPTRGTVVSYPNQLTLDSLVSQPFTIVSFVLAHDTDRQKAIRDSLNSMIKKARVQVEYRQDNMLDIVNLLRSSPDLRNRPEFQDLLHRTYAYVELQKELPPADQSIQFFLFRPESTPIYTLEYQQYARLESSVKSAGFISRDPFKRLIHSDDPKAKADKEYDIRHALEEHINEIGVNYKTSLVLGLPYFGAVWNLQTEQPEFEGYMPYSQILQVLAEKPSSIYFDKRYSSMYATLYDSTGGAPIREIYYDNSATLEMKIEVVLERNVGGVCFWALGYDHTHTDLWRLLEEAFAMPRFFNSETGLFEKITLEKNNKIDFTLRFQLKRFSRVIFATFFIIAIFMILGFNIVLLDWKVRDVLFYTGAFRIFYLTLFTMIILLIGTWIGLFKSALVTLLVGLLMGLTLTWIATVLVQKQQARLP